MTRVHCETGVLVASLVAIVCWMLARVDSERQAADALYRDGYRKVRIVGRECHVAVAEDAEGDRVHAWACASGAPWKGQ